MTKKMETMKHNANQTFAEMNRVALKWLAGRDPCEVAKNAGICYDIENQIYSFSSMGVDLTLSYPDYCITPQVDEWHYLLILHYLHLADGMPITGRNITFGQMKDGMIRGGGIDRKCEAAIRSMKDLDESTLADICQSIGGKKIQSNADVSYQIPFLPNVPVILNIWLPDEEFPASGRLLLDASIDHYFTIEDAVTMAEILIGRIIVSKQVCRYCGISNAESAFTIGQADPGLTSAKG